MIQQTGYQPDERGALKHAFLVINVNSSCPVWLMEKKATKKKATRKTLPKDLDELLDAAAESGDYSAVYEALQRCLPDARGGYGKGTLLMNRHCFAELARWAIERGTDIHATDTWGYTALHESARFRHRLTPTQLINHCLSAMAIEQSTRDTVA